MRLRHQLMLLQLHCSRKGLLQKDRSAACPRETSTDSGLDSLLREASADSEVVGQGVVVGDDSR